MGRSKKEENNPNQISLGSGLAEKAKKLLKGRSRSIDEQVESMVTGKKKKKTKTRGY